MRIGWIGLGRMGRPMAENLVRKGFDVAVQNRSQGKVSELAAMGATVGGAFDAMGAELDAVHTCLPHADVVREVVAGPGGLLDRPREGLVIVDHTTIHPDAARELAAAARERGAWFIDAPVSGSGPVAERGELTIMCGGDPDPFAKVRPNLEAMGKTIELMGASGSGAAAKVVNNVLMAANLAVAMEALVLASKAGLDLERLFDVVRTASGASRAWERNAPAHPQPRVRQGRLRVAHDARPGHRERDGGRVWPRAAGVRGVAPLLACRRGRRPRRGRPLAWRHRAGAAPRRFAARLIG